LERYLKERGHNVTRVRNNRDAKVYDENDLVVCAIFNRTHMPVTNIDFAPAEAFAIIDVLYHDHSKVVAVSFGSPYMLKKYFEKGNICINSYAIADICQNAFVKTLFGDIKANNFSPVKLLN
jgi:hypothetical protein